MLTLTKTVEAIRKLNTDPMIMKGACAKILDLKESTDCTDFAKTLIARYNSAAPAPTVITAFAIATSHFVGAFVASGNESTALQAVLEVMVNHLNEMLKLKDEMYKSPEKLSELIERAIRERKKKD